MQPALFDSRHLATSTDSNNFTDSAICVTESSVMDQILELRRVRPYCAEGVTNGHRNSAASNSDQVINKNHLEI
jgi:hypothetical protein